MKKQRKTKLLPYVFGICMLCIYFGMAYLLFFTALFEQTFSFTWRVCFGALFVAYGMFRAWRLLKNYQNMEPENDENE